MKNRFFISVVASLMLSNNFVNAKEISLQEAVDSIVKEYKVTYISKSNSLKDKKIDEKKINYKENALSSLNNILESNDLKAIEEDGVIYIIEKPKKTTNSKTTILEEISVNESYKNGSAENGYLSEDITGIGVWGTRKLQDTPYSMSVISSDLIENSFVTGIEDIAKKSPTVQIQRPSNESDTQYAAIRGFDLWNNSVIDGINLSLPPYGISYEEIERIEILNGLSGFMYGSGNVGGVINYVIKRPTYEKLANLTIGNYGGESYFSHLDLGNKIDEKGIFAYRLNISHQNGDTILDNQKIEKSLISGALDWNVSDNVLLQFEASHRENRIDSPTASFFYQSGSKRPANFDNTKTYTPDWTKVENETNRIGINSEININEIFDLRIGYKYKEVEDKKNISLFPLVNTDGTYSVYGPYYYAPATRENHGLYSYLDADFNTKSINHKMTMGVSGNISEREEYEKSVNVLFDLSKKYTLNELNKIQKVDLSNFNYGKKYKSEKNKLETITIGDDIRFNENWSTLLGFNHSTIKSKNYDVSGSSTYDYDKSEVTPTISIIYKPSENLSLYVSYVEGFERGETVPNDPKYNNPNKPLEPFVSKQYEIGTKYSFNESLLLSSALFRIEKANSFEKLATNNKIDLTQDGEEIHQGLELNLTGKITDNLTIISGGTIMDLSIEKSSNKMIEGKNPTGVSSRMAKIYAEYEIPYFSGLILVGGTSYNSKSYADTANENIIPSYTIYDSGIRYKTKLDKYPTTFNLNVANLTDKDYWVMNSSIGSPRTVAFSMKMEF